MTTNLLVIQKVVEKTMRGIKKSSLFIPSQKFHQMWTSKDIFRTLNLISHEPYFRNLLN